MNVFLTRRGRVKLGDLGVAVILNRIEQLHATRVGTPLYLAPEMIKREKYSFKVDVWALGCVVYQLASLKPPFFGDNLITLGYNICNGVPEDLPGQYSHRLRTLVGRFLKKDPNGRPSMSEVLRDFPPNMLRSKKTRPKTAIKKSARKHIQTVAEKKKETEMKR